MHGAGILRHVYRPTPVRTRTRCRTPRAHEETWNRSCGPGGTRFTDPSCERRYRYLHRPISFRRLIGSAREYLGPAIGPREKAFGACTLWPLERFANGIRYESCLKSRIHGRETLIYSGLHCRTILAFPWTTSDSVDRYAIWYAAVWTCTLVKKRFRTNEGCQNEL